jgi:hypothetical protein
VAKRHTLPGKERGDDEGFRELIRHHEQRARRGSVGKEGRWS